MESLITVLHVVAALFMILVVLVQGGNQGGMGAAFGGGNSQGVFGASGATSLLGKLTYGAAAVFMVTSISLTVIQGSGKIGLTEKLQQADALKTEKKEKEQAITVPKKEAESADPKK